MDKVLTEFTAADMIHGVVFTMPERDSGVDYEVYVDEFNTIWVHPKKSNELTAKIDKVTKRGFYWSKMHFGKRCLGFHSWTDLRKVEGKKKERRVSHG